MSKSLHRRKWSMGVCSSVFVSLLTVDTVQAQEAVDELVVLGSRIKRPVQEDTSTPLSSFGREDLAALGVKDARDLIQTLTINTGSQNNADALTQNFTAGTSNINLRGLGVSSTLVLLNGKRQVTSSITTDEGASFVDTASLVPAAAIKRVDILKDGASAIYGSDAVAGVANFVTRDDLYGLDLQTEHRTRTNNGTQEETHIDAAFGGEIGERGHFLVAASFLDRSSLVLGEVDWLPPGLSTSAFGNPATYVIPVIDPAVGLSSLARVRVPDPNCAENGGIPAPTPAGTFCLFDFGPQQTAVPDEQRLLGFGRATWEWNDTTSAWAEAGFARNRISREISPSLPNLSVPSVPVTREDNPFPFNPADPLGDGRRIAGSNIFMLGRAYGAGKPTETNHFDHDTYRVAAGAEGQFTDSVFWDFSLVYANNEARQVLPDTITANFQAALNGFGGEDCNPVIDRDHPQADEDGRVPATGGCLYFNPFSVTDPNNEVLRDFILGDYVGENESELTFVEAIVSGTDLFEMAGGSAGFALGASYREESLSAVYDEVAQNNGYAFASGNENFDVERDVWAVFGEILLPISAAVELNAALRHEDYGGGVGDTTDPKVSILWRPTADWSFRASAGSSFRAPSTHQLLGVQTTFANIIDPATRTQTFAANRTEGDESLQPETSDAINVGASYLAGAWHFDLDYWSFEFEDVLTRENPQQVVDKYPQRVPIDPNSECSDDPSRVVRTPDGAICLVRTRFVNANAIDTDGLDFAARAIYETDLGTFRPMIDATYILSYDITGPDGVETDGAGKMNRTNVGNPAPELRANIGLHWFRGIHSATIFYRYVDSYERNDTSRDPDSGMLVVSNTDKIDSYDQIDLQYSLSLGSHLYEDSEATLTIGVINAFDEDPPFVSVQGGYDPRTGDPRGRRVYAKLGFSF